MLPGKGKHGFKRTGKGGKDMGKVVPSTSKSKDPPVTKTKAKDLGEPLEDKDGVITSLPLFKTADNSRMLPRYTAVLSRSEEDGVGMEDLDTLQLELEALLSCVAVRNRVIREEIKLIESAEENRDKKTKVATPANVKRGATRGEERPMKKLKESLKSEIPLPGKLNKIKGPGTSLDLQSKDSPKPDAPKIVIRKNDTPNKFWSSVEPYCAPITPEDLSYLEDLIRTREKERDSDLMKIPPLGRHYSLRWADEDLGDEVKRRPDVTERIGGTTGPLTQRLISALIEEKISPLQEANENKSNRDVTSHRSSIKNVQSLAFERRVRKELRDQGILDGDEAPKEQADDELLLEIKRVQGELQAISAHNLQQLKHLHGLALGQTQRQDLKRKVKGIDTKLLNIFASKQEKKHFTKKEKDQAWRLIKEREVLLKQLYSINGNQ